MSIFLAKLCCKYGFFLLNELFFFVKNISLRFLVHRFLRSDVVKRVFLGVDLFSIILFQKCFFPHLMYFLFVLPCQVVMDNEASFKATRTVIHEQ